MADSSFDPLALVKAMGPQRDPYSWAEMYAQDASKSAQLREEIKNRLMLHESDQRARSKENALNREHTGAMHRETEAGRNARWQDRVKAGWGGGGSKSSTIIWPPDSHPEGAFKSKLFRNPAAAADYSLVTAGSHRVYVPTSKIKDMKLGPEVTVAPATAAPAATAKPAADDFEEFD